jgi:hypothetical protein
MREKEQETLTLFDIRAREVILHQLDESLTPAHPPLE